jgi:hypothetical protein
VTVLSKSVQSSFNPCVYHALCNACLLISSLDVAFYVTFNLFINVFAAELKPYLNQIEKNTEDLFYVIERYCIICESYVWSVVTTSSELGCLLI